MTYTLARTDYARKTTIATVGGIDAAIEFLYDTMGYAEVLFEEDAENPLHWDIFATGKGLADVYTVEPASKTTPANKGSR